MDKGIWKHPEWYPGLRAGYNKSAAFQRYLRTLPRRIKAVCPDPCPGDEGEAPTLEERPARWSSSQHNDDDDDDDDEQKQDKDDESSKESDEGAHRSHAATRVLPLRRLPRHRQARCTDGTPVAAPHIVVLMADDLGYADLGYMGSSVVHTPSIDALAAEAVHLTNFWASTWCAPSRTAFLTGRTPWEVGVSASLMLAPPAGLHLLPEIVKSAGYYTAIIGKHHIVPDRHAHPMGHPKVGHG